MLKAIPPNVEKKLWLFTLIGEVSLVFGLSFLLRTLFGAEDMASTTSLIPAGIYFVYAVVKIVWGIRTGRVRMTDLK